MSRSDEQLIAAMAEGDRAAFATLYDRYAPRVFGLLTGVLRDREAVEDVLQDVFVEAWRRAATFDVDRASCTGWLAVIARSRAYDHLRRRRVADRPVEVPGNSPVPVDAALVNSETGGRVRQALAALPAEQRAAIALAFYGGLTHEAIARLGGTPLGTVKTRIRIGMQRLRELLCGEGEVSTVCRGKTLQS